MGVFDWLFGKSRGSSARTWKVGGRVLAQWHDGYFYPGRIKAVSGEKCEVSYDDGDVEWVNRGQVLEPDVQAGSRVFARFAGGPVYYPGVVSQQRGEKLHVRFDDGDEEWTTLSMVRVQRDVPGALPVQEEAPAEPAKQTLDLGTPIEDGEWRAGDRVFARWVDLYWYPGTLLGAGTKGYHILYDDGDQQIVQHSALMPLAVEEGDRLQVRPKNEPELRYAEATVTRVNGETIDVEYEEGETETKTKVSRARFWRSPVAVRVFPFDEGDRVLAHDVDDYIYPAEIVTVEDDRIIVHFLDGPQRMLTPERIRRFELSAGQRIECRWKAGPQFFPGVLQQIDGERVLIHYDDGDKEWTTVRLVRMQPAK